ncbi:MAG: LemA family protein [Desulfovibrionaceae bacterium]|nr:LemA family protein [Desulfovibrionaceae bacterium]
MKKVGILFIVLILGVIVMFFWGKDKYNTMVNMDEKVKTAWSQVENQYQRRLDLVPNLVNTVKAYASHERAALEGVINARARATGATIQADNLNEGALTQFQSAQGELSNALSRLMVVVESYPNLKANENFRELQVQLEGTENRIAVERMRFNETAQAYNTYIRSFPNNTLAGFLGFEQRPYFSASDGAERAPVVDFGDNFAAD